MVVQDLYICIVQIQTRKHVLLQVYAGKLDVLLRLPPGNTS